MRGFDVFMFQFLSQNVPEAEEFNLPEDEMKLCFL